MHPDTQFPTTLLRIREDHARAAAFRHRGPRRARPPSRGRRLTAHLLVRLAARLTDEPVVVLPRRA